MVAINDVFPYKHNPELSDCWKKDIEEEEKVCPIFIFASYGFTLLRRIERAKEIHDILKSIYTPLLVYIRDRQYNFENYDVSKGLAQLELIAGPSHLFLKKTRNIPQIETSSEKNATSGDGSDIKQCSSQTNSEFYHFDGILKIYSLRAEIVELTDILEKSKTMDMNRLMHGDGSADETKNSLEKLIETSQNINAAIFIYKDWVDELFKLSTEAREGVFCKELPKSSDPEFKLKLEDNLSNNTKPSKVFRNA